ncbi:MULTISPECIES: hypothetical protein [Streptomyces]|uniref:hypothetical protein n=1 Tax=Streptomyces TaxID=1883 RepID=UPI00345BCA3B
MDRTKCGTCNTCGTDLYWHCPKCQYPWCTLCNGASPSCDDDIETIDDDETI